MVNLRDLYIPPIAVKRKIFISYHHQNDQKYYSGFSMFFSSDYEILQNRSLARIVDSSNTEYVMRSIGEKNISGSSCTIVLCGAETPKRKYVDWEIKATLDKSHGLIGIMLPTAKVDSGRYVVPSRFHDNVKSEYAALVTWSSLAANPGSLPTLIEQANSRSSILVDNSRPMKQRNG